jgi:hypothetical protein
MYQLEGSRTQDRAQDRIKSRQGPVWGQGGRDLGIDPLLIRGGPTDNVSKQSRISLAQLIAIDCPAETMPSELAHDCLGLDLRVCLKLIERLNRGQPRHTASPAAATLMILAVDRVTHPEFPARRRLISTIVRQARTAAPPWSRPSGAARAKACASFSTVRMP